MTVGLIHNGGEFGSRRRQRSAAELALYEEAVVMHRSAQVRLLFAKSVSAPVESAMADFERVSFLSIDAVSLKPGTRKAYGEVTKALEPFGAMQGWIGPDSIEPLTRLISALAEFKKTLEKRSRAVQDRYPDTRYWLGRDRNSLQ
ncbi:MAG TPA: hypothetical protein VL574_12100 [Stellaceae bacterium]|nr:hypothetical protein [Stellaceae bacterium]